MTRLKRHRAPRRQWVCHARALPGALLARFKMKEAGRGQLKSLRSFLRIFLMSSAYSSTIRRASCVREGLLDGSGPEVWFVILRHH